MMHFPVEIGIGNYKLSAHLVLETLAFMVGFRYFQYLRKNSNDTLGDDHRIQLLIAATFGAFFGSRIAGSLEAPAGLVRSAHPFLYLFSHKSIIGGLLGGLLSVEFTKKLLGVTRSSGDLMTYPLILALIVGRVGCFSSGVYEDTYGSVTAFFTGMDLGDARLRHPVALYEIAFLLLLWLGLYLSGKMVIFREGIRFQLFMTCYLLFRFVVEFLKPRAPVLAGLGTLQLFCLAGLCYYRRTLFQLCVRPVQLLEHA
jgi:phosphatidylglycerol:prolipoprotein diacylglycerol transferase